MADAESLHDAYAAHGPRDYYERLGGEYRNPHEPVIAELIGRLANEWPLDVSHVLDLAAGSGEVTLALQAAAFSGWQGLVPQPLPPRVEAIDPYTAAAYEQRTGRPCEAMSFEQIAAGGLRARTYSLVVCSFAMHLAEPSRLPTLCWELSNVARQLLILTPHKRPVIRPGWGWTLSQECLHRRVRARLYLSQPHAKGLS